MSFEDILNFSVGAFTVEKLLWAAAVVIVGYVLVRCLMKLLARTISRMPVDKTMHDFVQSGVKLLLYFVVALLACDTLGIPISSLLALFGVVGLAVSLSIQGSLSNLASGLLLLVTKPFSVGDYIESGSISGTVSGIALIYTRVTTPDNKVVFVPNGQLSAGQITNYTLMPMRRVELTATVSYSVDADEVKALLLDIARSLPQVLSEPAPFTGLSGTVKNTADYVLRAWCPTKDYWDVYYLLQERVKARLMASGLERPAERMDIKVM